MIEKEIPFCEYTGDPDEKSEIRLWFKCPKCEKRIWNHLYNEHVHNCSRAKLLYEKAQKGKIKIKTEKIEKERPKKVRLVTSQSTSKHKKRKPVNR